MRKIIVNEKQNSKKLNIILQSEFDGLSNSLFYKTLRKKDIRINGLRVTENISVKTGDEISIYLTDDLLFKQSEYEIIYEDNNIILINKPAGISVVEEDDGHSLTKVIQKKYTTPGFPYPCHRIDRNTSGLVLFAKNKEALNILFEKFKQKEIEKHYFCIVCGILRTKHDTLHSYLWKDAKKSLVYISDKFQKGYLPIVTSYQVVNENKEKGISLLDITLETR